MRTRFTWALTLPIALLAACGDQPTPTAQADPLDGLEPNFAKGGAQACAKRVNNTVDKLLQCVTVDGVRAHQAALQAIADANNGTRVSGAAGYDQSVDYVVGKLKGAGYAVSVQPFQFQTFISLSPSVVEQVSPAPLGPIANLIMSYSGSGDFTAPVTALPALGCFAADFAGFPAGNIALIPRGACTFASKATNAFNAGAVAVVIYNNGPGVINGTLGTIFDLDIPVTSVTQEVGEELAATPGLLLRVKTETFGGLATSFNVLAESRGGNPDNVIMVGGHLDAVNAGPGINDNGSGVGAVLETALQMAKVKPRNKVRFAFWGANKSGTIGSTYYVNTLSPAELNRITMYLHFSMLGSPNYVFFVYDGDDSDGVGAGPGPAGSAEIEHLFESFYNQRGLPFKGSDFSTQSDYAPFIAAGIPSGGLRTGGQDIKTPAEAALWGGVAGVAYDPCQNLACDTYDNVNPFALDVNADAVAFATLNFAMNTELVNGIKGKGNFKVKGNAASTNTNELAKQ